MKDKFCELCDAKGLKRKLKYCRVNFEEGILLCENDMCVYPFGVAVVDSLLLKTPATDGVTDKQGQGRKSQAKSTDKLTTTKTSSTSNIPGTHFYWSNSDNLCWLDSVMTILVNNRCLQLCLEKYQPRESILQQLYTNFFEAQKLGPLEEGKDILHNIRMKVFEFLKGKMKCSLGVNDSALASINVLLKESSVISKKFIQDCEWTFKCSSCGYTQVDRHKKLVVTFPNTADDFSMPAGVFLRACYKCKAAEQRSQLDLIQLPPCVMVHFVEGVKSRDFLKTGFVCQGNEYELCQLIQYTQNPDHFIAWIRNANGTHWAKIDDTQNVVCTWKKGFPSFPLGQVYLAVWERAKLYGRRLTSRQTVAKKSAEVKSPLLEGETAKPTAIMPQSLPGHQNGVKSHSVSSQDIRVPNGILSRKHESTDRQNIAQVGCESVFPTDDSEKSLQAEGIGQKRKNSFEPYIPKKKRNFPSSNETVTSPADLPVRPSDCVRITDSSITRSQWKPVSVVEKEKQSVVCDNQSDSGYSSPGSNSSCVSLPAQCTKEENLILNEIIDTLDEIELQQNGSSDKNSLKIDSRSSQTTTKTATDLLRALQSNSPHSPTQTKQASFSSLVGLSDYASKTRIDSSVTSSVGDTISELDLRLKSGSPCDFPDIETLSNCGNDVMDELDSINFYDSMDLSNEIETPVTSSDQSKVKIPMESPDSENLTKVFSTPDLLGFPSCEAEQSSKYIPTNRSDLQRVMKSLIRNSEEASNLEDLSSIENSTSCVQNSASFSENTKSLGGQNELAHQVEPLSFPTGHQNFDKINSSVKSVSFDESTPWLPCDFQPIELPAFIKHESNAEANSLVPSTDHISSCIEDILENVFPSQLLDGESGELTSQKTSEFSFEDDGVWGID